MDNLIVRKRVLMNNENVPPPKPEQDWYMRWPNGSEVYAAGGTGQIEQQLGWVIRRGAEHLAFQRTGPGEDDIKFAGSAPDASSAIVKLGGKLWTIGYKPPSPAPAKSPSQTASSEHLPAIRKRVRQPSQ